MNKDDLRSSASLSRLETSHEPSEFLIEALLRIL